MRFLFLLLLPCCALPAMAQNPADTLPDEDSVFFTPKSRMELWLSTDRSYHAVYTPDGLLNATPVAGFGKNVSLGVGMAREMTQRMTTTIMVEGSSTQMVTAETVWYDSSAYPGTHVLATSYYNYHYIALDLSANIRFAAIVAGKFRAGLTAGLAPRVRFVESTDRFCFYSNGSAGNENVFSYEYKEHPLNLDVRGGLFLEYGTRSRIYLSPVARYELFNSYKEVKTKHAYSAGLALGCDF